MSCLLTGSPDPCRARSTRRHSAQYYTAPARRGERTVYLNEKEFSAVQPSKRAVKAVKASVAACRNEGCRKHAHAQARMNSRILCVCCSFSFLHCRFAVASFLPHNELFPEWTIQVRGARVAHFPGVDRAQGELAHIDLLPGAILLPSLHLRCHSHQTILIPGPCILLHRHQTRSALHKYLCSSACPYKNDR